MQEMQLIESFIEKIEAVLERFVLDIPLNYRHRHLIEAMQYVVMSGGKKIRPLLVKASGLLSFANESDILKVAAAIELIHCYSLVHDDLPAMDNDDLRRGRLTCHKKYGDATAILVGDALQSLAFDILTSDDLELDVKVQLKIANTIAHASGPAGMVGGQAIDILNTGKSFVDDSDVELDDLKYMHSLKTGKIIQAAVLSGYLCGTEFSDEVYQLLINTSADMGLLFQIIDDILDVVGDTITLGKTAQKDMAYSKVTYVSLLGLQNAKDLAADLYNEIYKRLICLPNNQMLLHVVQTIYNRHN